MCFILLTKKQIIDIYNMKPKYIETKDYHLLVDLEADKTEPNVWYVTDKTGYIGKSYLPPNDGSVSNETLKSLVSIDYKDHYIVLAISSDNLRIIAHLPKNGAALLEGIPLLPAKPHLKKEKVLRWVKASERLPTKQNNYCIRTMSGHYTTAFCSLGGDFNEYTKNVFGRDNAISEWLEETEVQVFDGSKQLEKLIRDFKYMAANSGNDRVGALCNEGWMMLTDFMANQKIFSLDDMKAAFWAIHSYGFKKFQDFMGSLMPQYEFVPEILWGYDDRNGNSDTHFPETWQTLKTITSLGGDIMVIGEWIRI